MTETPQTYINHIPTDNIMFVNDLGSVITVLTNADGLRELLETDFISFQWGNVPKYKTWDYIYEGQPTESGFCKLKIIAKVESITEIK